MSSIENILVIRQSALGDVANVLPILRLLRQAYPAAKISCLTGSLTAGLMDENADVDQVLNFNRTKKLSLLLPVLLKLRAANFDLVVDLQSSRHSRWLTLATGAKMRLGRGGGVFYTHPQIMILQRHLRVNHF